jgi:predicted NBD/HSP70 family sugar kinase
MNEESRRTPLWVHTQSPGSPSILRRLNAGLVLRTARANGPMSRADLARQTGLSKPTVNQAVEFLLSAGYLEEAPPDLAAQALRPGRRGRPVQFRLQSGCVLGIDVGAHQVRTVAADFSGHVLGRQQVRVDGSTGRPSAGRVLELIHQTALDALREAGMAQYDVKAVGVGTPGVVDPSTREVTLAQRIDGWEGVRLEDALRLWFDCQIRVENDVNLALLAEQWLGAAKDVSNVVYINLGVGIGAGIVIDGRLYHGARGAAGEVGYLPLTDSLETGAPSTRPGAFEQAAGGSAIARRGRAAAQAPDGALLRRLAGDDLEAIDARLVFEAAQRGDPAAMAIVEDVVHIIARGVAAISSVLNPAVVVVGGGLSNAGQTLVEAISAQVEQLIPFPPTVVVSSLGDQAVPLGAVRLALQVALHAAVEKDLQALFFSDGVS